MRWSARDSRGQWSSSISGDLPLLPLGRRKGDPCPLLGVRAAELVVDLKKWTEVPSETVPYTF
jgi:hypothetical protein